MPRVFDNIEAGLLPALRQTLQVSERGDFCVGYFNLRGWKSIDDLISAWPGGEGGQCRLLVGMQKLPQDELRSGLGVGNEEAPLDNQTALRIKRKLAEEFRVQLTLGMPNNTDEAGLRRLAHATGAVYLDAEYTVVEGAYAKRKIWSLIGLYSPKGPDWGNAGRGLIKGILNSARGIDDKDNSAQAQAKRRISGFAELDGIEFIARMDIGSDTNGEDKNEVRSAVTPSHRDYAQLMGHGGAAAMLGYGQPPVPNASQQGYTAPAPQQPPPQTPATPGFSGRPSWAE